MYDVIMKKRNGNVLDDAELKFVVDGYTKGEIPDYQVSALLMAIYFQGLNEHETAKLTEYMAYSGETIDLSVIDGIKVDKHSTGGVGDKTTLVIGPIVAACGVPVAKMSGRGLGHTGGTIDKLEAIKGLQTSISKDVFFDIVNRVGVSVIGQTGNLAPADKLLYALRDVTATVDNVSLIAASIMSKKIAAGSDAILLDVKTGDGAFMKSVEDSVYLAKTMVSIGENVGRKTVALITDMDRPLGFSIGNSLEVIEAVDTLKGQGPDDLTEICIELSANMLYLANKGSIEDCKKLAKSVIDDGSAFLKFKEMVAAQSGDVSLIENVDSFEKSKFSKDVLSTKKGYISEMCTEQIGIASVVLGAGRANKEDMIDYAAGIVLKKKIGDFVEVGETLAVLHTGVAKKIASAEKMFYDAITLSEQRVANTPLIHARITNDAVEYFKE